jgi:DNA-binding winged helix-turn-helix (wHTH) protein/TolB-like protein
VGEWSIDPALDEISRGSEVIKLEPRMMRLLCRLAEARGQVVSSQQLLDSVWAGVVVGPASVYQAISALRKILGDSDATPTYIATVLRKGYRLIADVEGAASVAASAPASADLQPTATTIRTRRTLRLGLGVSALAALAAIVSVILVVAQRKEPASVVSAPVSATRPAPDMQSIAIQSLHATVPGDGSELFAACMTEMLHNRLATQKGLLAISPNSADTLSDPLMDVRDVGKRLHAKYLLRGDAARVVDQLRVNVTLLDAASGEALWSQSYTRTAQEITALREEIVAQVGTKLNVRIGTVGDAPIDLAAYEIFMRGEHAMHKLNTEGFTSAKAIFYRATVLHPDFARPYLGFAQSLFMLSWSDFQDSKNQKETMIKALDRALELDPEFGEAMIWRAQFIEDPVKAEELYRRGLDLVPSYDSGAFIYADFLSSQGRSGEAIDVINRGLRVDPLSDLLMQMKADILAYGRGDIPAQQDVLRELLAARPNAPMAILALGWSRYAWSGETAEAIGLFERAIASDPAAQPPRFWAASAYLDVDDPAAALSAAKGTPYAPLQVAQFRREAHAIALMPAELQFQGSGFWAQMSASPVGDALRDEAIVTGNYARALASFEKIHSTHNGAPVELRGMELVHAHTLILSGDTERGRGLAKSLLQLFDAEEIGRPKHWFARDRASVYAMLGDYERALSELTESVRRKDFVRWWYTAESDPLFARLRKDPRFQALAAKVKQHRAEQRALLEEMRRKGEVPKRP